MEKIIRKTFESETKEVDGERALNVTITTRDKDRDGDIVEPQGVKLINFRKNPVVLLAHDYRGLPIARAEKLEKTEESIKAKVIFPEEGTYPIADTVYNLYKNKFMKAWSIGFIPLKTEDIDADDIAEDEEGNKIRSGGRRFKSVELLEFSACSVPANPHALSNMVNKGIDLEPLKEAGIIEIENGKEVVNKPEETETHIHIPVRDKDDFVQESFRTITIGKENEGIQAVIGKLKSDPNGSTKVQKYIFDKSKGWTMEKAKKWVEEHGKSINLEDYEAKGVIPFKETPKAPEDEDWDAAKEVREAEVEDLKVMCVWYDSENPDIKQSYKLPHHKAKGHAVVWKGVAAAMAALMGARGGVAIPESDKKGVYNHLAKHYKQFDKEPPELRDYESEELGKLFPDEDVRKSYNAEEIYEIVKLNKELLEKVKELELKFGAVLNRKNKQNLKDAQQLIQEVLDSAEPEEDSLNNDEDSEKEIEVIDENDSIKDDDIKDKVTDEDEVEVDDEIISKVINESLNYLVGKVKSNAKHNQKKGVD